MFLTFYFSNFLFALPVEKVLEIKKSCDITPVPKAPPHVEGIINLRGEIITAIHLGRILSISYDEEKNDVYHIIMKSKEESVSLIVEDIGDVINLEENDLEPVPEHLEGIDTKYVKNICKLSDRLLILLDVDMLEK